MAAGCGISSLDFFYIFSPHTFCPQIKTCRSGVLVSLNCLKVWVSVIQCSTLVFIVINWQTVQGVFPLSPNIKNSIHSQPFCWQASVFPTFSHLIVRRNNSITQRLQGQPSSACSETLYNYQLSKYEKKPCQAFVYLWCRCGWAQWAGARYDWNVWIAVGCGHGVWHCPHSQRKGWTDCAPPPWTGLSPSPSPHLREGEGAR